MWHFPKRFQNPPELGTIGLNLHRKNNVYLLHLHKFVALAAAVVVDHVVVTLLVVVAVVELGLPDHSRIAGYLNLI